MGEKSIYPKAAFNRGIATGLTSQSDSNIKICAVKHNLPGSIILVHGVNDVGTAYDAVESGLCAGLTERLRGDLKPAIYRLPNTDDRKRIEEDPDAVFFKRKVTEQTHSPIIPFYWGFREEAAAVRSGKGTKHGQAVDRHGNRLDKDYSKGGGPFANATSTLPDMWNRGKSGLYGLLDKGLRDATHPMKDNPGRLYMVLAARRLAALITMIRDYDINETVSIVAHSQGCMLGLLAQAFLLDARMLKIQANARPADTLVLCNPPYSLVDDIPALVDLADRYSGDDKAMAKRYSMLESGQTLHARLTTLVNIVKGVHEKKHLVPALADLPNTGVHCGVVGSKWEPAQDRDNRGKVYLYFSPEDMTVALANVQGIGWQGVPEFVRGRKIELKPLVLQSISEGPMETGNMIETPVNILRRPLQELGSSFFQRVFTMKRRPDFQTGLPVLVGKSGPPDVFSLRGRGEDDQSHTDVSDTWLSKHGIRGHLPGKGGALFMASDDEKARHHLRIINGEALPRAVAASMNEGVQRDSQGREGASESVDPIESATCVTSKFGFTTKWECISKSTYSQNQSKYSADVLSSSPAPHVFDGKVHLVPKIRYIVQEEFNREKHIEDQSEILRIYECMQGGVPAKPFSPPKFLIERDETGNEARLRWQNTEVPRSFHSAVYGGRENHRQVTAFDVAIGGGKAPTDPFFYLYLCAVADWRLKIVGPDDNLRPGILSWIDFEERFARYLKVEPAWRAELIEGTSHYYSSGTLPMCLPLFPDGLPSSIVSETMDSHRISAKESK